MFSLTENLISQILQTKPYKRTLEQQNQLFKYVSHQQYFQTIIKVYGHSTASLCCDFMKLEKYQKDQVIFKEGDNSDKFYIVLSGSVKLKYCSKNQNNKITIKNDIEDKKYQQNSTDFQKYFNRASVMFLPEKQIEKKLFKPEEVKNNINSMILNKFSQSNKQFRIVNVGQSFGDLYIRDLQSPRHFHNFNNFNEQDQVLKDVDSDQEDDIRYFTAQCFEDTEVLVFEKQFHNMLLKDKNQEKRLKHVYFLMRIPLFKGVTFEFSDDLFNNCYIKNFKKGETVYKQNDIPDNFYIIKSGSYEISTFHILIEQESAQIYETKQKPAHLRLQQGNQKRKIPIAILGEQQIIGEQEIKKGERRLHNVTCIESGVLYVIPRKNAIIKLFSKDSSYGIFQPGYVKELQDEGIEISKMVKVQRMKSPTELKFKLPNLEEISPTKQSYTQRNYLNSSQDYDLSMNQSPLINQKHKKRLSNVPILPQNYNQNTNQSLMNDSQNQIQQQYFNNNNSNNNSQIGISNFTKSQSYKQLLKSPSSFNNSISAIVSPQKSQIQLIQNKNNMVHHKRNLSNPIYYTVGNNDPSLQGLDTNNSNSNINSTILLNNINNTTTNQQEQNNQIDQQKMPKLNLKNINTNNKFQLLDKDNQYQQQQILSGILQNEKNQQNLEEQKNQNIENNHQHQDQNSQSEKQQNQQENSFVNNQNSNNKQQSQPRNLSEAKSDNKIDLPQIKENNSKKNTVQDLFYYHNNSQFNEVNKSQSRSVHSNQGNLYDPISYSQTDRLTALNSLKQKKDLSAGKEVLMTKIQKNNANNKKELIDVAYNMQKDISKSNQMPSKAKIMQSFYQGVRHQTKFKGKGNPKSFKNVETINESVQFVIERQKNSKSYKKYCLNLQIAKSDLHHRLKL